MSNEVEVLRDQLNRLLPLGTEAASQFDTHIVPKSDSQKKKPVADKTVLVIGDKAIRPMRMKILAQLPRKSSVVIRQLATSDIENVKRETLEFLSTNQQEVHVVLHCGYSECMNFNKDDLLRGTRDLVSEATEDRNNVSFSMATIPPFTRECNDVNQYLLDKKNIPNLDTLDMTFAHRHMILRGQYSYSNSDVADPCAKTIARKAASFLGTELKSLKPRIPSPSGNVQLRQDLSRKEPPPIALRPQISPHPAPTHYGRDIQPNQNEQRHYGRDIQPNQNEQRPEQQQHYQRGQWYNNNKNKNRDLPPRKDTRNGNRPGPDQSLNTLADLIAAALENRHQRGPSWSSRRN